MSTILGIPEPRQATPDIIRIENKLQSWRTELVRMAEASPCGQRCEGCAFRLGTEANRTAMTILDAVKAVCKPPKEMHGKFPRFICHEHPLEEMVPCKGWMAARVTQLYEEAAYEVAEL